MPELIIHGASSFIGKHFLRRLAALNIPAVIIARESSDLTEFELQPAFKITRYNKRLSSLLNGDLNAENSVFFDFSWHGVFGADRNNPSQFTVNIPLIIDSVELAHRIGSQHWISFGSQAEYGNRDKVISENDTCHPTTFYGKAKLLCSKVSAELCAAYQMQHSWLRLFSVYGPDDNHEWLIPYLIKTMLGNEPVNATPGEQRWDYLFIDDIISMLLKLSVSQGVGIANLGSGESIQVKKVISLIKDIIHSESKINLGAIPYRPDQVMLMQADISRLKNHLDWQPAIKMEEGLKKTINSFLKENVNGRS